jgi:hypothetical protein
MTAAMPIADIKNCVSISGPSLYLFTTQHPRAANATYIFVIRTARRPPQIAANCGCAGKASHGRLFYTFDAPVLNSLFKSDVARPLSALEDMKEPARGA